MPSPVSALRLAILVAFTLLPGPHPAAAQEPLRGVALVVGQSDYELLPPLFNPHLDAIAVHDLLTSVGFDATLVTDATHAELLAVFDAFRETARSADLALIYYAGHGVEAGGEHYLVPVDTDIASLRDDLMAISQQLTELAATGPILIFLGDACRTNPFAGTSIALPDTNRGELFAIPVAWDENVPGSSFQVETVVRAAPAGALIGFATGPNEPALDGRPGTNSPYAAALLAHLGAAGRYSLGDAMIMVTEEVYQQTEGRQRPWTSSSLRTFLNFGAVVDDTAGDDRLIANGRRELLLLMSMVPESFRGEVEERARSEGRSSLELFGALVSLGEEPELEAAIGLLMSIESRQRILVNSDNPEAVRLGALSAEAVRAGAVDVALDILQRADQARPLE